MTSFFQPAAGHPGRRRLHGRHPVIQRVGRHPAGRATSGLIGLDGAVYVLFGQNIGTCITAVLASIGTGREAKQTTIIHLTFNLIGTAIFTTVCILTANTSLSLTHLVSSWTPGNPAAQIANMHTLFNVVTTLLLLFGTDLAAFAQKVLPLKDEPKSEVLQFLKPLLSYTKAIGKSAISLQQVDEEIAHMIELAQRNVEQGFEQLRNMTARSARRSSSAKRP
ncbi:MAG: Na/Pi symporter [Merdibacter sp.]